MSQSPKIPLTSNLEPMNVCQIDYTDGFEIVNKNHITGESKDWQLCNLHATFSHKEACEFIFYIGNKDKNENSHADYQVTYKGYGFSEYFLTYIREAQELGFNFILFYA